jgi:hypothetical protein
MIGGMIVIDLLYLALGSFGVGIPAVAGLYFKRVPPTHTGLCLHHIVAYIYQ